MSAYGGKNLAYGGGTPVSLSPACLRPRQEESFVPPRTNEARSPADQFFRPPGPSADPGQTTVAPPFCGPVNRGFYVEPWEPASLVHSMEHAHVVLWYNTADQGVIDDLVDFARNNSNTLLVVTPYPDMEEETIALTAWARIDEFPAHEWDGGRAQEFLDVFGCRFDPEDIC